MIHPGPNGRCSVAAASTASPLIRDHIPGCDRHTSAGWSAGTLTTGTGEFRTTFSAVLPMR